MNCLLINTDRYKEHGKEVKKMKKDEEDWIDRFDRRTIELLWTIFLSMVTAIITTILASRLGLL
jgi:hypothetical protein